MIVGLVIGHVWATKKEDSLSGMKLMLVKELPQTGGEGAELVAADVVGAGIGEQVLVVSGSTARRALGRDDLAIDAAIVGIIDSLELDKQLLTVPSQRKAKK